jgi:hypothetical protein
LIRIFTLEHILFSIHDGGSLFVVMAGALPSMWPV